MLVIGNINECLSDNNYVLYSVLDLSLLDLCIVDLQYSLYGSALFNFL